MEGENRLCTSSSQGPVSDCVVGESPDTDSMEEDVSVPDSLEEMEECEPVTTFYSVDQDQVVKLVQLEKEEVRVKIVQPSEDLDRVRLMVDPLNKDEEPIHGFLDNRTVFVDSFSKPAVLKSHSITSSAHFSFLRSAMSQSLRNGLFCDLELVLGREILKVNRLVAGLALSCLGPVWEDLCEAEVVLLPDHTMEEVRNSINIFGGMEKVGGEKDLEVNFLNLDPLPPEKDPDLPGVELKCDKCEAFFVDREGLSVHRMVCGGDKKEKLQCQVCRLTFPNMYSLVTHEVESHQNIRVKGDPALTRFQNPVECFKCKKMMEHAWELVDHGCSHTKYNPTKCASCSKILANRSQMISHECPKSQQRDVGLELGHSLFEAVDSKHCQVCGKGFNSVRRTIIHEVEECNSLNRRHHPDFRLKIYNCDTCKRNFVVKNKFRLHMERHALENSTPPLDCINSSKTCGDQTVENQDQENNIENIDPEPSELLFVATSEENIEAEVTLTVNTEEDVKTEDATDKGSSDFLKALKQLQELEAGSTSCNHCGKKLSSRKACVEHEVNVHGDLSNAESFFKCDFCPKIFVNKTLRNNHLTTHTDERKFQCHLCALRFKTTGNLNAHLASIHDPADNGGLLKKFACKFCPKTFRFPAQIQQHERVHTKEKPFNCKQCGKGFSVKCNLKAHMETHKSLDERIFKCTECDHSATTLPLLKLHMHTHTGERPFVCDDCGESYKRPSNLRRHKKGMCKPRLGVPVLSKQIVEEELYESIETVVVQEGEGGDIIIEEYGEVEDGEPVYEVEEGMVIESMEDGGEAVAFIQDLCEDSIVVEEGIVEDDGIKYETQLVTL